MRVYASSSAGVRGSIDSYVVVIGKSPVGSFGCCSLQSIKHCSLITKHDLEDYFSKLLLNSRCSNQLKYTETVEKSRRVIFETIKFEKNNLCQQLWCIFAAFLSSYSMRQRITPEVSCHYLCHVISDMFVKQDGAHTVRQTQEWLKVNCTNFISKDQCPPNSPDLTQPTRLPCVVV